MRFGDKTGVMVLDVTYLSIGNTVSVVRRGKTVKAAILSNSGEWLEIEASEALSVGTVISEEEFEERAGKSWPPFFSQFKVLTETYPSGSATECWEDEEEFGVVEVFEKKS